MTDFIKEVALQSVMLVWGWLWQKQSSSIRAVSSRRKTGSQAVQNLKSAFIGGLLKYNVVKLTVFVSLIKSRKKEYYYAFDFAVYWKYDTLLFVGILLMFRVQVYKLL